MFTWEFGWRGFADRGVVGLPRHADEQGSHKHKQVFFIFRYKQCLRECFLLLTNAASKQVLTVVFLPGIGGTSILPGDFIAEFELKVCE